MATCLYEVIKRLTAIQTAFHASFEDSDDARDNTLKVSRATSVVSGLPFVVMGPESSPLLGPPPGLHPLSSLPAQVSCILVREYATGSNRRGSPSRYPCRCIRQQLQQLIQLKQLRHRYYIRLSHHGKEAQALHSQAQKVEWQLCRYPVAAITHELARLGCRGCSALF